MVVVVEVVVVAVAFRLLLATKKYLRLHVSGVYRLQLCY